MPAQGQAAIDLETFRCSKMMEDIRSCIEEVAVTGVDSVVIAYEILGTTREGIFAVTILRNEGYDVKFHKQGILVNLKGGESA